MCRSRMALPHEVRDTTRERDKKERETLNKIKDKPHMTITCSQEINKKKSPQKTFRPFLDSNFFVYGYSVAKGSKRTGYREFLTHNNILNRHETENNELRSLER